MPEKKLLAGFSTYALKKHRVKEAAATFRSLGYPAVELSFVHYERIEDGQMDEIEAEDLQGFEYVSLHAPKYTYKNNASTQRVFEKIESIHDFRPLDLVVFHPDTVIDLKLFRQASFPIAFENMDSRKDFGQIPEDIISVLEKSMNFRMVLDINHAYTVDPTLALAKRFYDVLGDRIAQIHISGFSKKHDPLSETGQKEFARAIQNFDVPIILECLTGPDKLEREWRYFTDLIKAIQLERK